MFSIDSALFALALVATIVGLLALMGIPYIKGHIKRQLDEQVMKLRREALGHVYLNVGYIFGSLTEQFPKFRNQSIEFSEIAYNTLPEVDLKKREVNKLLAMNNLAYYYAERKHPTDGPTATKYVQALRRKYYPRTRKIDFLTTFAFVAAEFYEDFADPRKELDNGIGDMLRLQKDESVSEDDKEIARQLVGALRQAKAKLR